MKKGMLIAAFLTAFLLTAGIASAHFYFSFAFPPFSLGFGGPPVVAPPQAYYPYPYGSYYYPRPYGYYGNYYGPGYYGPRVWVPGYWGFGGGGRAWIPGLWGYHR